MSNPKNLHIPDPPKSEPIHNTEPKAPSKPENNITVEKKVEPTPPPQPPTPIPPYNRLNGQSGNETVGKPLKRMKLVYKGDEVKFEVNPEDYTQVSPHTVMITQTKGGAWIDSWGEGLQEITIKGITGVKGIDKKDIEVGYQRWRRLRDLFKDVATAVTEGQEIKDYVKFYNYTDNEYWNCYPAQGGIELYRSKSRPHVYQYTIHLIGLIELGQPSSSKGVIGNPNAPQPTATGKSKIKTSPSIVKTSNNEGSVFRVARGGQTKSKSVEVLDKQITKSLKSLSKIVDGKDGKVSLGMAYHTTSNLNVGESGVVSNIPSMKVEPKNEKIPVVSFISDVGSQGAKIQKGLENFNAKYVYAPKGFPMFGSRWKIINELLNTKKTYTSEFLSLIENLAKRNIISKMEKGQLKVVLLSIISVYVELSNSYNSLNEFKIPKNKINQFIKNIQALTLYYGDSRKEKYHERLEIVRYLRNLEKNLLEINNEIIPYL